jgi:hypothetical protein
MVVSVLVGFSIDFYNNVIGVSINCQIQVINSSIFSLCWFEFKLFVKKVQVCANLIFTSFFIIKYYVIHISAIIYNFPLFCPVFYCYVFKGLKVYFCCYV